MASRDNATVCRERRLRKRGEILAFLGGQCVRCTFSDPRALQIDHKYGGGGQELRGLSPDARHALVYAEPERFQLLCANCNWIKRAENGEAAAPVSY